VPRDSLSEEARVMVLRALLIQRQSDLKIFRASSGSSLAPATRLVAAAVHALSPAASMNWPRGQGIPQLDTRALRTPTGSGANQLSGPRIIAGCPVVLRASHCALRISALWLDGFQK
jgi:hypothetical protein